MTENGTEFGMLVHEITTTLGQLETTTYSVDGTLSTYESGTTYGDEKISSSDVAMVDVGTGGEAITEIGTVLGMADHEITTTLGYDGTVTNDDDGTLVTSETGTTYGEQNQLVIDDGIMLTYGATVETMYDEYDEAGIVTRADYGTLAITETGTESGTLDQATIIIDGDEAIVI